MAADVVTATVAADAIDVAALVSTARKQRSTGPGAQPGGSCTKILERMSTKQFSRKNTDTTTPSDFSVF